MLCAWTVWRFHPTYLLCCFCKWMHNSCKRVHTPVFESGIFYIISFIKINSCKCCPVSCNWSLLGCKKSELLHFSGGWGRGRGCNLWFVMVNHVPESEKAPQQQQFPEQWDQHQEQSKNTHVLLYFFLWFGQSQPMFWNVCSLWTPVWEVCPGPAQLPALTPTPPRAPVSLPAPPHHLRLSPPFVFCLFASSP